MTNLDTKNVYVQLFRMVKSNILSYQMSPCCDVHYDFRIKTMFDSPLSPGGLMYYLRYLCLLAHSSFQRISCCVFSFVCLRIVYPMLPVSLNCPFLITPSVFANVYSIHSSYQEIVAIKTWLYMSIQV